MNRAVQIGKFLFNTYCLVTEPSESQVLRDDTRFVEQSSDAEEDGCFIEIPEWMILVGFALLLVFILVLLRSLSRLMR